MDIQLIKELASQMENSPTTISAELQHSNPEEYEVARKLHIFNSEKGDLKDFYCPICKNKGFYHDVSETGNMVTRECSCMAKRTSIENARNSGMSGILQSKTFDNFEQKEEWQKGISEHVLAYVSSIKQGNHPWLCVLGQSGCGKTHLCCAVANKFLNAGATVSYMVWNNAVKELKRNATDDAVYSKLLDKYENADVLYIDDFFKGKVTDADINIAFELINNRCNNPHCITIISSELMVTDLCNIDEAIAGRIVERTGDNLIQIKPDKKKNYRMKSIKEF